MGDKGFNKTDMERIGIFQEPGYISIGDRYKSTSGAAFNTAAGKGNQMLPGGSKTRSALQAGYFHDKFNRMMEGEAYSDPIKMRRQHRIKEGQKNIGKPFLPSSGDKKSSGLGGHYGTLAGPISAFSPVAVARKAYKVPGKNLYTNPGKHGTGFGYLNVTIGNYQKHQSDPYDKSKDIMKKENESHKAAMKGGSFKLNMHPKSLFDDNPFRGDRAITVVKRGSSNKDVKPFRPSHPGKNPAGMHAGTFDPYPSHSVDAYGVKYQRPVQVVNKTGKTFMPNAGPKSAPITSVLDQNVTKTINKTNYKTTTQVMCY